MTPKAHATPWRGPAGRLLAVATPRDDYARFRDGVMQIIPSPGRRWEPAPVRVWLIGWPHAPLALGIALDVWSLNRRCLICFGARPNQCPYWEMSDEMADYLDENQLGSPEAGPLPRAITERVRRGLRTLGMQAPPASTKDVETAYKRRVGLHQDPTSYAHVTAARDVVRSWLLGASERRPDLVAKGETP
jgi:hypothetical protein